MEPLRDQQGARTSVPSGKHRRRLPMGRPFSYVLIAPTTSRLRPLPDSKGPPANYRYTHSSERVRKSIDALVKIGDPTTTRGKVVSFHDSGKNHGISIARHGDKASCGTCPGLWPIIASCELMRFHSKAAVQDGDLIASPRGKNRVIAMSTNMHYCRSGGGASRVAPNGSGASISIYPNAPRPAIIKNKL
ncbi:PAAR domain-containing protein [Dyella monticola]|uniref:PAAR domain-containing protein n=1 Tax=Dyella monticola TaxID=1927958 RepID=UPI0026813132